MHRAVVERIHARQVPEHILVRREGRRRRELLEDCVEGKTGRGYGIDRLGRIQTFEGNTFTQF